MKKSHYPPSAQYVSTTAGGGDAAFCYEVGALLTASGLVSNRWSLLEIKRVRRGIYLDLVLAPQNKIGRGYHNT